MKNKWIWIGLVVVVIIIFVIYNKNQKDKAAAAALAAQQAASAQNNTIPVSGTGTLSDIINALAGLTTAAGGIITSTTGK